VPSVNGSIVNSTMIFSDMIGTPCLVELSLEA